MKVITLDLSSALIGMTIATIEKMRVTSLITEGMVPYKATGKDFGYSTIGEKTIGEGYKAFLYPDEHHVSKAEANRRKQAFKNERHRRLLYDIGRDLGGRLDAERPDYVAIERNESFNGVQTTKLLAEIAGCLYFYTGQRGIPFSDHNAGVVRATVRSTIPLSRKERRMPDGSIGLDTKSEIYCRLRKTYSHLVDFTHMTLDESDSLAVFHHLKTEKGWTL